MVSLCSFQLQYSNLSVCFHDLDFHTWSPLLCAHDFVFTICSVCCVSFQKWPPFRLFLKNKSRTFRLDILALPLSVTRGVVSCGVVWRGVVWCGVLWCGVVWCRVVWCGVLFLVSSLLLHPGVASCSAAWRRSAHLQKAQEPWGNLATVGIRPQHSLSPWYSILQRRQSIDQIHSLPHRGLLIQGLSIFFAGKSQPRHLSIRANFGPPSEDDEPPFDGAQLGGHDHSTDLKNEGAAFDNEELQQQL